MSKLEAKMVRLIEIQALSMTWIHCLLIAVFVFVYATCCIIPFILIEKQHYPYIMIIELASLYAVLNIAFCIEKKCITEEVIVHPPLLSVV